MGYIHKIPTQKTTNSSCDVNLQVGLHDFQVKRILKYAKWGLKPDTAEIGGDLKLLNNCYHIHHLSYNQIVSTNEKKMTEENLR